MDGREVIYFFIGILSFLLIAISFLKPFVKFIFKCGITICALALLKNIGFSVGINALNVFMGAFLGLPGIGALLIISSFLNP
jgi:hypothetical protein